ncbi:MAG: hypothetical protein H0X29_08530 [Parachlamydiaceae bacterium]|nr:hypothetical protein [Parachlamydiaceae bacterium]
MVNFFKIISSSLALLFFGQLCAAENDNLLARGEHRIEVQNYGHKSPEVPMDIMQANYYNAHHEYNVIRFEDLNRTINREINEDANKEYNDWFNAEYNSRLSEYPDDPRESYRGNDFQEANPQK